MNTEDSLIARLIDEDEDARYEAAEEIRRTQLPDFATLLEWAADPRPYLRAMTCYLLRARDESKHSSEQKPQFLYPQAIPTLIHLLENDSDADVRASAAPALSEIGHASALPFLLRASTDPDKEVRFSITQSLGCYNESDWEKDSTYKTPTQNALLHLMDDEDSDVRDWATFGIHQGDHNTPEARARLWKALDDTDSDVRGEAVAGLAKFGDSTLIPRLAELMRQDANPSPLYFEVTESLAEPSLLPFLYEAVERWQHEEGSEEWLYAADRAIETLEKLHAERIAATSNLPQPEEKKSCKS